MQYCTGSVDCGHAVLYRISGLRSCSIVQDWWTAVMQYCTGSVDCGHAVLYRASKTLNSHSHVMVDNWT